MIETGARAHSFRLRDLNGAERWISNAEITKPTLIAFFAADCPSCQLTFPYLQNLAQAVGEAGGVVIGISQDSPAATKAFIEQTGVRFPVLLDSALAVSKLYDPESVPTLYLLDADFAIAHTHTGYSKEALNLLGAEMCLALGIDPPVIAPDHDGAPHSKPGCGSRHREADVAELREAPLTAIYARRGPRASRVEVPDDVDPYDYCREHGFGDPLPVVPPTVERVERMLGATPLPPDEVIGLIAPNYAMATVEKIAANAVMAGCAPEMMRVLPALVRAVCDEKFNIHGVQATTHFAAPLIVVNGPIRNELGFWSRGNVFSNVRRANSTLGRALQLILTNLGGARPAEIDMSTLGNPGKFSYCIAENEEESPWEPLNIERGFRPDQSTVSLYAGECPAGVSEHNAREGKQILRAISYALRNVWTFRSCMMAEAMVVICPEHAHTMKRDGYTKALAREFLFENTGIPVKAMEDVGAEGTQFAGMYGKITIDGEPHYRKFREPGSIKIVVAGGTAGKFSAVIGSWLSGPRGSEMVTYPIE